MAIKSNHDSQSFVMTRIGYRLADDLLMAKMNPVEKANRQAGFASNGMEFLGRVDDFHVCARSQPPT